MDLASAIIDKLPEIKIQDHALAPGQILSEQQRSGILALHRFLAEADPSQAKLGLHRVATYTGDYRWLCDRHYEAWQPNIPRWVEKGAGGERCQPIRRRMITSIYEVQDE